MRAVLLTLGLLLALGAGWLAVLVHMRRMTPNQYVVLLVLLLILLSLCASVTAALASWDPKVNP